MALNKYKLGTLIVPCDERNTQGLYTLDDVKGISTGKEFIDTKANMDGVSLSSYKVVKPQEFAYVADTSRRGEKIAIAFNSGDNSVLISSIYTVFRISNNEILNSDYLFMYFNRPEFDRYSRFNSWGSARETFDWDTMCDIDIELPDLATQQKYVDIYNAMVANQQSYERGLEDLKLVCDGYIEDLRRKMPCEKIGPYIKDLNIRNLDYSINKNMAVSIEKKFVPAHADLTGVDIGNYLICRKGQFAYNTVTTKNSNKLSIAYNKDEDCLVSPIYTVFGVCDERLFPEYLMLWFIRTELDRYARYNSWGSAREMFTFDEMKLVEIPIPSIEEQKAIANIYTVYVQRKEINEQLKNQIKDICPILIKGSLEESV